MQGGGDLVLRCQYSASVLCLLKVSWAFAILCSLSSDGIN